MKILLASDSYDPSVGGVQRVAHDLAHGLTEAGHQVRVVTPWLAGSEADETVDGVPVTRVRLGRPALRPRAVLGFARRVRGARRAVDRLMGEFRPDVVHLHFLQSPLAYLLPGAASRIQAALVGTVHGRDVGEMVETDPVGRAVVRRFLRRAGAVTAPSGATLAAARDLAPEATGAFHVVMNALPRDVTERLGCPAANGEPGRVLAIGELHPKKGFDVLLRALVHAPTARLRIAGAGESRGALARVCGEVGVAERVEFLGFVSRDELLDEIDAACVQVVPSRREPFGLVILEGFAAGKAVIASRVDGIPEVVGDEPTAVLVPPEDPTALGRALADLLGDPERRADLGRAARARAAEFTQEATTEGYLRVYADALRG